MATVFDVAKYILNNTTACTSMKLQKLAYYSQAWSLAWDDKPLFNEDFQAWANGPVCPELFRSHKGKFSLPSDYYNYYPVGNLTDEQKENIDIVLRDYAELQPYELSSLTHSEYPWIKARGTTPPGMPCETVIEKEDMREYYCGIIQNDEED